MTRMHLYPTRRMAEIIGAMFAGGYGLTVLRFLPDGNPLYWADYTMDEAIWTAAAMIVAAFVHAFGIRINGHWRWSPVLRFAGMTTHAAMFLMLAHAGAYQTAGYVYTWITVLMAAGAYSAFRDVLNAIRGDTVYAGN